jgi:hypothetical protein
VDKNVVFFNYNSAPEFVKMKSEWDRCPIIKIFLLLFVNIPRDLWILSMKLICHFSGAAVCSLSTCANVQTVTNWRKNVPLNMWHYEWDSKR